MWPPPDSDSESPIAAASMGRSISLHARICVGGGNGVANRCGGSDERKRKRETLWRVNYADSYPRTRSPDLADVCNSITNSQENICDCSEIVCATTLVHNFITLRIYDRWFVLHAAFKFSLSLGRSADRRAGYRFDCSAHYTGTSGRRGMYGFRR